LQPHDVWQTSDQPVPDVHGLRRCNDLKVLLPALEGAAGIDPLFEMPVFTLATDGVPRHIYSAHPAMSPDIRERGIDLLNPIWNFLDLTPKGREDFVSQAATSAEANAALIS